MLLELTWSKAIQLLKLGLTDVDVEPKKPTAVQSRLAIEPVVVLGYDGDEGHFSGLSLLVARKNEGVTPRNLRAAITCARDLNVHTRVGPEITSNFILSHASGANTAA